MVANTGWGMLGRVIHKGTGPPPPRASVPGPPGSPVHPRAGVRRGPGGAGNRGGPPGWRASLEKPHNGERLALGDAKDLLTFLADLMADLADGTTPLEKVESD